MRLIDADALMDKTDDRYSLGEIGRRERDDIIDALEFAPTIKPEPRKRGKWQWCGNHHLCSECDEWALTRWDEDECDEVDILTNFCPNCGADMRGTECDEKRSMEDIDDLLEYHV